MVSSRRLLCFPACFGFALVSLLSASASAQLQPLPPPDPQPPPAPPAPAPAQPAPAPPPPAAAQGTYGQPAAAQPGYGQPPPQQPSEPPVYYAQPPASAPPASQDQEQDVPTHAPKFALYAGVNLHFIGFGGNFYVNEANRSETVGNFVGKGLSVEVDVGARLGRRYIPYLFIDHGFVGPGHRFQGSEATSSTDLAGIGFRYVSGDVNSAGFLSELAVGFRTVTVTNGNDTYKMKSFELFRLGLGAEIRLATLFSISPLARLSGGVMSDSEGTINYSPEGSRDGITRPTFTNGQPIETGRGYVIVSVGMGGHFDIFGK